MFEQKGKIVSVFSHMQSKFIVDRKSKIKIDLYIIRNLLEIVQDKKLKGFEQA